MAESKKAAPQPKVSAEAITAFGLTERGTLRMAEFYLKAAERSDAKSAARATS